MRHMGFLSLALAATLVVGCKNASESELRADDPAVPADAAADSRGVATDADRDFVRDAALASMAEVELGRMAVERGASASVKAFGQQMVDNHSKVGDELLSLASEHHLVLPSQIDEEHRALRDKLITVQGGAFNRQYIDAMIDGHENVLSSLESRLDSARLAEWTARITDPGRSRPETPRAAPDELVPEQSDNAVTMAINRWAAKTYPGVREHLESARRIDSALSKGRIPTN